jgi:hypothetical protein
MALQSFVSVVTRDGDPDLGGEIAALVIRVKRDGCRTDREPRQGDEGRA